MVAESLTSSPALSRYILSQRCTSSHYSRRDATRLIRRKIQIQTWNVFNSLGQISMYDATFTAWWQWAVDTLLGVAQTQLSTQSNKNVTAAETQTYIQSKLATSICSTKPSSREKKQYLGHWPGKEGNSGMSRTCGDSAPFCPHNGQPCLNPGSAP